MKQRYQIHFNPKPLSEDQIKEHQNFDKLLQSFAANKHVPSYRRLYFQVGAIAASLALLIAAYYVFRPAKNYEELQSNFFASKPYVSPPLANVKPTFASFELDNTTGGEFVHSSGSKLNVPPAAFINNKGIPVEGKVKLHFREMHDFVDFFLSGIPMTYDSAGVKFTLESAGMIEVYAEQDGERVALARDKSIGVELVSNVNVPASLDVPKGFNIYKLDENGRNWRYTAIDRMSTIGSNESKSTGAVPSEFLSKDSFGSGSPLPEGFVMEKNALSVKLENEKRKIEQSLPIPPKPFKPQKAGPSDYVFELDFSAFNNPKATGQLAETQQELAKLYQEYDRILWRLAPGSNANPEKIREQFAQVEKVSISHSSGTAYEITLKKGTNEVTILAEPVLTGTDFTKASKEYEHAQQVWSQKIAERQSEIQQKIAAVEREIRKEEQALEVKYQSQLEELRRKGLYEDASNMRIQKAVVNKFEINSLGIWNCDRPLPAYMTQLSVHFINENGKPLKNLQGYLVDQDRNTIGMFYVSDYARIRFNAFSKKLLWLVTEDGKIAVLRPEDFDKVEKDVKEFTFALQTIDKEINDEKDVRDILYL